MKKFNRIANRLFFADHLSNDSQDNINKDARKLTYEDIDFDKVNDTFWTKYSADEFFNYMLDNFNEENVFTSYIEELPNNTNKNKVVDILSTGCWDNLCDLCSKVLEEVYPDIVLLHNTYSNEWSKIRNHAINVIVSTLVDNDYQLIVDKLSKSLKNN